MIENHFRPTARRFCECGVSFLVYWGLGSKAKAQSRDHRRRHRWKRLCLCLLLWVEQESKISPMLHPQRSTHDSTHQTVKEAAILHRRHSKPPDEGLLGFFFPIPLRSGSQLHLRWRRHSYKEKGWLNSTPILPRRPNSSNGGFRRDYNTTAVSSSTRNSQPSVCHEREQANGELHRKEQESPSEHPNPNPTRQNTIDRIQ
jgi:hypothetical protein